MSEENNTLQAGVENILSDDICCSLLAILWTFDSNVFIGERAHTDLALAGKRVNLFGGEKANLALIQVMNNKIKEISHKPYGYQYPQWLRDIGDDYNINIIVQGELISRTVENKLPENNISRVMPLFETESE